MDLCFPRTENTSWYSDVSFVTTGPVKEALVWLTDSVFVSWIALVRCSSPSATHVSRLRRGGDLVFSLATRKVAVVLLPVLMRQSIRQGVQVSMGRTTILFLSEFWGFPACAHLWCSLWKMNKLPSFLLPHWLKLQQWHNYEGEVVYSDLEGEIQIGGFLLFLFLDILSGWLWFWWRIFLSRSFFLYTCKRNDSFLNTGHMFFQRRGSLILALCGLYHRIDMCFLSCCCAMAWVCVYLLVSSFSLGEFC